MLTPQEVGEKAFPKATFGGYSMPQVDEFLDVLTADYGTLYTENAVLKSKMKVLVDTVEEYRSTEEAMRKALMSAQRMADEMIHNAEEQRRAMMAEAEDMAKAKLGALQRERETEEFRLAEAQRAVQEFSAQARAAYQRNIEYLNNLDSICPAPVAPTIGMVQEEAAGEIEENVQRILNQAIVDASTAIQEEKLEDTMVHEIAANLEQIEDEEEVLEDEEMDFSDLEFGQNYQLR